MKFNPYPVLLTTGALMLATVILAQGGLTASLVKATAVSVSGDFSSSTVKIGPSSQDRVLIADEPPEADVAHHPGTRVAAVDGAIAAGSVDRALEQ
jgi:hypothetical protein